jgi:hypothetical protein
MWERLLVTVGLFPKKQNVGARNRPVGLEFTFTPDRIDVRSVDLAGVEGLADKLTHTQRLRHALSSGPKTLATLAEELSANVESLDREVRRKKHVFARIPGADGVTRIALLERRSA